MTLTVGSLFSGIGGFDLGLERAGMRVIWQVENDAKCQQVLSHHWPEVELDDDVRTATELAPVDLICGGFPCQDLSVAGKRAGLDGERSGLWFEFRRVVSELRPEWVLVENVPGLLSSNGGRDMGVVVRGLEELGYRWAYRVLDSQYFGVPQRRRRVFIVGCAGKGSPAQVLFDAASLQRHPPTRKEAGSGIAGTLEARSATGGYDPGAHGAATGHIVAQALTAREAKGPCPSRSVGTVVAFGSKDHGADATEGVAPTLRSGEFDGSWQNGGVPPAIAFNCQQDPISADGDAIGTSGGADRAVCFEPRFARNGRGAPEEVVPPLKAESGRTGKGDSAPCVAFDTTQITHPENRSNPQPGDPSPALAKGGHAPAITGAAPRRLTPRECERLQGFPDDWTMVDGMADGPRYRMLGNAVTVNVAEWIGRRILEVA